MENSSINSPSSSPAGGSKRLTQYLHDGEGLLPYSKFTPTFTQTAVKMHALGGVLIGLGVVLAIGAIGGGIVFSGFPIHHSTLAIVISVASGAGAITAVAFGIHLLKKSYWGDPAFCQMKREEILNCLMVEGYTAAREKYRAANANPEDPLGWHPHQLISNEQIASLLLQEHLGNKSYSEIQSGEKNKISTLYADGIFARERFKELLLNESASLAFSEFLTRYTWKPFAEKVVSCNDSIEIASPSTSSGARSNKNFADRFLDELTSIESFERAYSTFPGFWKLFTYQIATGGDLRESAVAAFETVGFSPMIEKYSWKLFDHIVSKENKPVMDAFKRYLKTACFIDFLEKYLDNAKRYAILPNEWKEKIGELSKKHRNAKQCRAGDIEKAKKDCAQAIKDATSTRDGAISPSKWAYNQQYWKVNTLRGEISQLEGRDPPPVRALKAKKEDLRSAELILVTARDTLTTIECSANSVFETAKEGAKRVEKDRVAAAEATFQQVKSEINEMWLAYIGKVDKPSYSYHSAAYSGPSEEKAPKNEL